MKVCFVTDGYFNDVWQNKLDALDGADLIVFGFNGLGLVSYKKELSGETEYFQDVAKLSRQSSAVIVCGCDTDTYGVFRHSAVVADKGKILGVSDSVYSVDESEFVAGGSFKVYQTSVGRIGVIIAEDALFADSAKVLAMCDAEFIICIVKRLHNFMPQIIMRANAFSNGVAMALVAKEHVSVSDIRGKIVLSTSADVAQTKIKIEKDYHLVSSKRRGFSKDNGYAY